MIRIWNRNKLPKKYLKKFEGTPDLLARMPKSEYEEFYKHCYFLEAPNFGRVIKKYDNGDIVLLGGYFNENDNTYR